MVKQSSLWVAETIAAAERKRDGAVQKIQYFKDALSVYSDLPLLPRLEAGRPRDAPPTGGQQTPVPALDDSFIDRIVALSESNVRFRQQLTEDLVAAQLEAVVGNSEPITTNASSSSRGDRSLRPIRRSSSDRAWRPSWWRKVVPASSENRGILSRRAPGVGVALRSLPSGDD